MVFALPDETSPNAGGTIPEGDEESEDVFYVERKFGSSVDMPAGGDRASKRLSVASQHYDIGSKGFLTPAEQKARDLDADGQGRLDNHKVVGLIERTDMLQSANIHLQRMLVGILLVTVFLGLSQIGTAIAVARLSKDTSVDSGTGYMTVQGDDSKGVVIISRGRTNVWVVNQTPTDNETMCVGFTEFTDMFANIAQGETVNVVKRTLPSDSNSVGSAVTVGFTATGQHYDDTEACFSSEEKGPNGEKYEYCTFYTLCTSSDDGTDDADDNQRRLRLQQEQEFHRHAFHHTVQRKLILVEAEDVKDDPLASAFSHNQNYGQDEVDDYFATQQGPTQKQKELIKKFISLPPEKRKDFFDTLPEGAKKVILNFVEWVKQQRKLAIKKREQGS